MKISFVNWNKTEIKIYKIKYKIIYLKNLNTYKKGSLKMAKIKIEYN